MIEIYKNKKYNIAYVVCVIIKLFYFPWNYAEITRNAVLTRIVTVAQCKNRSVLIIVLLSEEGSNWRDLDHGVWHPVRGI